MNKSLITAAIIVGVVVVLSAVAATQGTKWIIIRPLPTTDFVLALMVGVLTGAVWHLFGEAAEIKRQLTEATKPKPAPTQAPPTATATATPTATPSK